jgi:hypothetical protein
MAAPGFGGKNAKTLPADPADGHGLDISKSAVKILGRIDSLVQKHEGRMEKLTANGREADSPPGTEDTKCSLRPLRPSVKSGSKF